MAKQTVNLGVIPDGVGGDDVRTAFTKVNNNFTEVYDNKVDKESGKSLVSNTEITKLVTVQENATANRADSLNADKIHGHTISDVTGLDAELLTKFDKVDIAQVTGSATDKVMSQKAITDSFADVYRVMGAADAYTGSYGLEWDSLTDTYKRVGSGGFTAIQSRMKRCVLNDNGTVNYFLNPINSNYKLDGSPANLTGTDGNVMVQIPKFYVKYTTTDVFRTSEVSLTPDVGYVVHPAFIKDGVEVDFRYYRAYKSTVIGGKLMSVSNSTPTRSRTISSFRVDARANGVGWHQTDWNLLNAVRTLMIIEIGTLDTQSVLGYGNAEGANYGRVTGVSNHLGNGSSDAATVGYMSYRGIEDFYGSAWEFVDGVSFKDREVFVNSNQSTFESDVFTGDYISTGLSLPVASSSFIKDMSFTAKGFIPTTVGGSSSTYVADALWSNTGNRIALHGGDARHGRSAGGFCLYAHDGSGLAYSGVGAGVAF